MKKSKLITAICGLSLAAVATVFIAADHIDAPAVTDDPADIADLYAYESPQNEDNTVFIVTLPGQTIADGQGTDISFSEDVLIEVNIDVDGDASEDFVIQAIPRDGLMYFNGPVATTTNSIGKTTTITAESNFDFNVAAEIDGNAVSNNGISYFAGKRSDAFFFDFGQFNQVKMGPDAAPNGFNQDGTNTFAPLNVNAIVVEVPNSILGPGALHPANTVFGDDRFTANVYNVWVETKRRQ